MLLLDQSSKDTSDTAGPPAPCAVFQPPSVTVQRDRAALFERKPFVHGSFEKMFLQGRLDGADRFTFEEFGVGSEAEGCQYVGLHLL